MFSIITSAVKGIFLVFSSLDSANKDLWGTTQPEQRETFWKQVVSDGDRLLKLLLLIYQLQSINVFNVQLQKENFEVDVDLSQFLTPMLREKV